MIVHDHTLGAIMMRVAQVQQLTTEQTGSKDSACQASLVIPGKNTLALDLFFSSFVLMGRGWTEEELWSENSVSERCWPQIKNTTLIIA